MKNLAKIVLLATLISACGTDSVSAPSAPALKRSAGMVVTANPLATQAGARILDAGGTAVDAAIAIQSVLSLVEPQSSGLAGGAFMVFYDQATKDIMVYDGRETAPSSAQKDRFLLKDGSAMRYLDAKHSGLSTGVPGVISMLQMAHSDHGKLPWADLFDAAKRHANEGFEVSPRLHGMIQRFGKFLPHEVAEGPTEAWRYFHTEAGDPLPVGHLLRNPDYAKTLDILAADPNEFYDGEIAQQIVAQVNREPRSGGMTMQDLADYSASRRTALCADYKTMRLCGPPPPSSWLAVAMTMGILERSVGFSSKGADDADNWTLFAEAQRLAYADRDHFVADVEHVMVPVAGLLSPDYLAQRATEISSAAMPKAAPGDPWSFSNELPRNTGADATEDAAGTSHFVVVDQAGNVVSMTSSVESIFGSARMAGGMFLNNQLTDFSFQPVDEQGKPIANAVAAGKRPRSSMSPTIVLDQDGNFKMATGSPGGNSIIAYTLKTLVGVLEWGLTPQQAVDLPNMVARGDVVRIEQERASRELIDDLREFGFELKESRGENSGLSVVIKDSDGNLTGGVDPRREGTIEIVF